MDVFKRLMALLLTVALIAVLLAGGLFYLWRQPAAAIVDRTRQATAESAAPEQPPAEGEAVPAQAGGEGGADPNTAVLNPNVQLFFGADATAAYAAVQATSVDAEGRVELILSSTAETAFSQLDAGKLFFLDGDDASLFGGAYIGKVADRRQNAEGNTVLTIESAAMDEAFDALNVDLETKLTKENLVSYEAVEGVNLQLTENLAADYAALEGGSGLTEPQPMTPEEEATAVSSNLLQESLAAARQEQEGDTETELTNAAGMRGKTVAEPLAQESTAAASSEAKKDAEKLNTSITDNGVVISVAIDLVDVFGSGEKNKAEDTKSTGDKDTGKKDGQKTQNDKQVEILENGGLANDWESLKKSASEGDSCELKGKIALTDIEVDFHSDWALNYLTKSPLTLGFRDLSADYKANLSFDIGLQGNMTNLSLSSINSQYSIGTTAKFQGLPYKKFPLCCLEFSTGIPIKIVNYPKGNAGIATSAFESADSFIPKVMAVLYLDTNGNVTVSYSMGYNVVYSIDGGYNVIQNFEHVWEQSKTPEVTMKRNFSAGFDFEADMDAHVGVALDMFLCGVNIVDLNLIKLGAEMEGKGQFSLTASDEASDDGGMDPSISQYLDLYARLYIKLIDFHFKFTASLSFLNQELLTVGFDEFTWTWKDYTLGEWGNKRDTYYNPDTMSVQMMTAEDQDNIYFLTEEGQIAKQSKTTGFASVLCDVTMTRFVGIDRSYLYYLKPGESNYDLCRVAKDSGISRTIQTDVVNVLGEDSTRLFFTSGSDRKALLGIDRDTRKTTTFATFENNVQVMEAYRNTYYVVTQSDDIFSQMFGGGYNYYLLDSGGNLLQEFGENPAPHDLPRWSTEKDMFTSKLVKSGQLHSTSAAVYWISSSSEDSVQIDGVSGWNNMGDDICVTQDAEEGSELPYIIRRYSAVDGHASDVVAVHSNQAFFTLCQADDGRWYYFDEDAEAGELYLYRMNADLSEQTLLATYPQEEFGVSLEKCGMDQIDGKLIFYSITGNDDSSVGTTLLRYDIY